MELYGCKEDGYPSPCILEDNHHLKDEYFQDDLIGSCFKDPPLTVDHLSKDKLCEMLEPFNLLLNNHMERRRDQDGRFGYVIIE